MFVVWMTEVTGTLGTQLLCCSNIQCSSLFPVSSSLECPPLPFSTWGHPPYTSETALVSLFREVCQSTHLLLARINYPILMYSYIDACLYLHWRNNLRVGSVSSSSLSRASPTMLTWQDRFLTSSTLATTIGWEVHK